MDRPVFPFQGTRSKPGNSSAVSHSSSSQDDRNRPARTFKGSKESHSDTPPATNRVMFACDSPRVRISSQQDRNKLRHERRLSVPSKDGPSSCHRRGGRLYDCLVQSANYCQTDDYFSCNNASPDSDTCDPRSNNDSLRIHEEYRGIGRRPAWSSRASLDLRNDTHNWIDIASGNRTGKCRMQFNRKTHSSREDDEVTSDSACLSLRDREQVTLSENRRNHIRDLRLLSVNSNALDSSSAASAASSIQVSRGLLWYSNLHGRGHDHWTPGSNFLRTEYGAMEDGSSVTHSSSDSALTSRYVSPFVDSTSASSNSIPRPSIEHVRSLIQTHTTGVIPLPQSSYSSSSLLSSASPRSCYRSCVSTDDNGRRGIDDALAPVVRESYILDDAISPSSRAEERHNRFFGDQSMASRGNGPWEGRERSQREATAIVPGRSAVSSLRVEDTQEGPRPLRLPHPEANGCRAPCRRGSPNPRRPRPHGSRERTESELYTMEMTRRCRQYPDVSSLHTGVNVAQVEFPRFEVASDSKLRLKRTPRGVVLKRASSGVDRNAAKDTRDDRQGFMGAPSNQRGDPQVGRREQPGESTQKASERFAPAGESTQLIQSPVRACDETLATCRDLQQNFGQRLAYVDLPFLPYSPPLAQRIMHWSSDSETKGSPQSETSSLNLASYKSFCNAMDNLPRGRLQLRYKNAADSTLDLDNPFPQVSPGGSDTIVSDSSMECSSGTPSQISSYKSFWELSDSVLPDISVLVCQRASAIDADGMTASQPNVESPRLQPVCEKDDVTRLVALEETQMNPSRKNRKTSTYECVVSYSNPSESQQPCPTAQHCQSDDTPRHCRHSAGLSDTQRTMCHSQSDGEERSVDLTSLLEATENPHAFSKKPSDKEKTTTTKTSSGQTTGISATEFTHNEESMLDTNTITSAEDEVHRQSGSSSPSDSSSSKHVRLSNVGSSSDEKIVNNYITRETSRISQCQDHTAQPSRSCPDDILLSEVTQKIIAATENADGQEKTDAVQRSRKGVEVGRPRYTDNRILRHEESPSMYTNQGRIDKNTKSATEDEMYSRNIGRDQSGSSDNANAEMQDDALQKARYPIDERGVQEKANDVVNSGAGNNQMPTEPSKDIPPQVMLPEESPPPRDARTNTSGESQRLQGVQMRKRPCAVRVQSLVEFFSKKELDCRRAQRSSCLSSQKERLSACSLPDRPESSTSSGKTRQRTHSSPSLLVASENVLSGNLGRQVPPFRRENENCNPQPSKQASSLTKAFYNDSRSILLSLRDPLSNQNAKKDEEKDDDTFQRRRYETLPIRLLGPKPFQRYSPTLKPLRVFDNTRKLQLSPVKMHTEENESKKALKRRKKEHVETNVKKNMSTPQTPDESQFVSDVSQFSKPHASGCERSIEHSSFLDSSQRKLTSGRAAGNQKQQALTNQFVNSLSAEVHSVLKCLTATAEQQVCVISKKSKPSQALYQSSLPLPASPGVELEQSLSDHIAPKESTNDGGRELHTLIPILCEENHQEPTSSSAWCVDSSADVPTNIGRGLSHRAKCLATASPSVTLDDEITLFFRDLKNHNNGSVRHTCHCGCRDGISFNDNHYHHHHCYYHHCHPHPHGNQTAGGPTRSSQACRPSASRNWAYLPRARSQRSLLSQSSTWSNLRTACSQSSNISNSSSWSNMHTLRSPSDGEENTHRPQGSIHPGVQLGVFAGVQSATCVADCSQDSSTCSWFSVQQQSTLSEDATDASERNSPDEHGAVYDVKFSLKSWSPLSSNTMFLEQSDLSNDLSVPCAEVNSSSLLRFDRFSLADDRDRHLSRTKIQNTKQRKRKVVKSPRGARRSGSSKRRRKKRRKTRMNARSSGRFNTDSASSVSSEVENPVAKTRGPTRPISSSYIQYQLCKRNPRFEKPMGRANHAHQQTQTDIMANSSKPSPRHASVQCQRSKQHAREVSGICPNQQPGPGASCMHPATTSDAIVTKFEIVNQPLTESTEIGPQATKECQCVEMKLGVGRASHLGQRSNIAKNRSRSEGPMSRSSLGAVRQTMPDSSGGYAHSSDTPSSPATDTNTEQKVTLQKTVDGGDPLQFVICVPRNQQPIPSSNRVGDEGRLSCCCRDMEPAVSSCRPVATDVKAGNVSKTRQYQIQQTKELSNQSIEEQGVVLPSMNLAVSVTQEVPCSHCSKECSRDHHTKSMPSNRGQNHDTTGNDLTRQSKHGESSPASFFPESLHHNDDNTREHPALFKQGIPEALAENRSPSRGIVAQEQTFSGNSQRKAGVTISCLDVTAEDAPSNGSADGRSLAKHLLNTRDTMQNRRILQRQKPHKILTLESKDTCNFPTRKAMSAAKPSSRPSTRRRVRRLIRVREQKPLGVHSNSRHQKGHAVDYSLTKELSLESMVRPESLSSDDSEVKYISFLFEEHKTPDGYIYTKSREEDEDETTATPSNTSLTSTSTSTEECVGTSAQDRPFPIKKRLGKRQRPLQSQVIASPLSSHLTPQRTIDPCGSVGIFRNEPNDYLSAGVFHGHRNQVAGVGTTAVDVPHIKMPWGREVLDRLNSCACVEIEMGKNSHMKEPSQNVSCPCDEGEVAPETWSSWNVDDQNSADKPFGKAPFTEAGKIGSNTIRRPKIGSKGGKMPSKRSLSPSILRELNSEEKNYRDEINTSEAFSNLAAHRNAPRQSHDYVKRCKGVKCNNACIKRKLLEHMVEHIFNNGKISSSGLPAMDAATTDMQKRGNDSLPTVRHVSVQASDCCEDKVCLGKPSPRRTSVPTQEVADLSTRHAAVQTPSDALCDDEKRQQLLLHLLGEYLEKACKPTVDKGDVLDDDRNVPKQPTSGNVPKHISPFLIKADAKGKRIYKSTEMDYLSERRRCRCTLEESKEGAKRKDEDLGEVTEPDKLEMRDLENSSTRPNVQAHKMISNKHTTSTAAQPPHALSPRKQVNLIFQDKSNTGESKGLEEKLESSPVQERRNEVVETVRKFRKVPLQEKDEHPPENNVDEELRNKAVLRSRKGNAVTGDGHLSETPSAVKAFIPRLPHCEVKEFLCEKDDSMRENSGINRLFGVNINIYHAPCKPEITSEEKRMGDRDQYVEYTVDPDHRNRPFPKRQEVKSDTNVTARVKPPVQILFTSPESSLETKRKQSPAAEEVRNALGVRGNDASRPKKCFLSESYSDTQQHALHTGYWTPSFVPSSLSLDATVEGSSKPPNKKNSSSVILLSHFVHAVDSRIIYQGRALTEEQKALLDGIKPALPSRFGSECTLTEAKDGSVIVARTDLKVSISPNCSPTPCIDELEKPKDAAEKKPACATARKDSQTHVLDQQQGVTFNDQVIQILRPVATCVHFQNRSVPASDDPKIADPDRGNTSSSAFPPSASPPSASSPSAFPTSAFPTSASPPSASPPSASPTSASPPSASPPSAFPPSTSFVTDIQSPSDDNVKITQLLSESVVKAEFYEKPRLDDLKRRDRVIKTGQVSRAKSNTEARRPGPSDDETYSKQVSSSRKLQIHGLQSDNQDVPRLHGERVLCSTHKHGEHAPGRERRSEELQHKFLRSRRDIPTLEITNRRDTKQPRPQCRYWCCRNRWISRRKQDFHMQRSHAEDFKSSSVPLQHELPWPLSSRVPPVPLHHRNRHVEDELQAVTSPRPSQQGSYAGQLTQRPPFTRLPCCRTMTYLERPETEGASVHRGTLQEKPAIPQSQGCVEALLAAGAEIVDRTNCRSTYRHAHSHRKDAIDCIECLCLARGVDYFTSLLSPDTDSTLTDGSTDCSTLDGTAVTHKQLKVTASNSAGTSDKRLHHKSNRSAGPAHHVGRSLQASLKTLHGTSIYPGSGDSQLQVTSQVIGHRGDTRSLGFCHVTSPPRLIPRTCVPDSCMRKRPRPCPGLCSCATLRAVRHGVETAPPSAPGAAPGGSLQPQKDRILVSDSVSRSSISFSQEGMENTNMSAKGKFHPKSSKTSPSKGTGQGVSSSPPILLRFPPPSPQMILYQGLTLSKQLSRPECPPGSIHPQSTYPHRSDASPRKDTAIPKTSTESPRVRRVLSHADLHRHFGCNHSDLEFHSSEDSASSYRTLGPRRSGTGRWEHSVSDSANHRGPDISKALPNPLTCCPRTPQPSTNIYPTSFCACCRAGTGGKGMEVSQFQSFDKDTESVTARDSWEETPTLGSSSFENSERNEWKHLGSGTKSSFLAYRDKILHDDSGKSYVREEEMPIENGKNYTNLGRDKKYSSVNRRDSESEKASLHEAVQNYEDINRDQRETSTDNKDCETHGPCPHEAFTHTIEFQASPPRALTLEILPQGGLYRDWDRTVMQAWAASTQTGSLLDRPSGSTHTVTHHHGVRSSLCPECSPSSVVRQPHSGSMDIHVSDFEDISPPRTRKKRFSSSAYSYNWNRHSKQSCCQNGCRNSPRNSPGVTKRCDGSFQWPDLLFSNDEKGAALRRELLSNEDMLATPMKNDFMKERRNCMREKCIKKRVQKCTCGKTGTANDDNVSQNRKDKSLGEVKSSRSIETEKPSLSSLSTSITETENASDQPDGTVACGNDKNVSESSYLSEQDARSTEKDCRTKKAAEHAALSCRENADQKAKLLLSRTGRSGRGEIRRDPPTKLQPMQTKNCKPPSVSSDERRRPGRLDTKKNNGERGEVNEKKDEGLKHFKELEEKMRNCNLDAQAPRLADASPHSRRSDVFMVRKFVLKKTSPRRYSLLRLSVADHAEIRQRKDYVATTAGVDSVDCQPGVSGQNSIQSTTQQSKVGLCKKSTSTSTTCSEIKSCLKKNTTTHTKRKERESAYFQRNDVTPPTDDVKHNSKSGSST